jgi:hypothetical protein
LPFKFNLQRYIAASESGAGVSATVPQLCCRVASLHFLRRRLASIEKEVGLALFTTLFCSQNTD